MGLIMDSLLGIPQSNNSRANNFTSSDFIASLLELVELADRGSIMDTTKSKNDGPLRGIYDFLMGKGEDDKKRGSLLGSVMGGTKGSRPRLPNPPPQQRRQRKQVTNPLDEIKSLLGIGG